MKQRFLLLPPLLSYSARSTLNIRLSLSKSDVSSSSLTINMIDSYAPASIPSNAQLIVWPNYLRLQPRFWFCINSVDQFGLLLSFNWYQNIGCYQFNSFELKLVDSTGFQKSFHIIKSWVHIWRCEWKSKQSARVYPINVFKFILTILFLNAWLAQTPWSSLLQSSSRNKKKKLILSWTNNIFISIYQCRRGWIKAKPSKTKTNLFVWNNSNFSLPRSKAAKGNKLSRQIIIWKNSRKKKRIKRIKRI